MRLVVMISGRGSNLRAIVDAIDTGSLTASVVAVISNKADAAGLQFSQERGIAQFVVEKKPDMSATEHDAALNKVLTDTAPDLIVLAGYMSILGAQLVNQWLGRMINIHPSLLPRYPGLNTHARVLAAGDAEHGASVHFVTPELDAGPVLAQVRVPVAQNDTVESLSKRVLAQEHVLYAFALQYCVKRRAQLLGGKCYVDNELLREPLQMPVSCTQS